MTTVTALIEFLVGLACMAMAWASWRHPSVVFRAVAVALGLAGATAVVNAVASVLSR